MGQFGSVVALDRFLGLWAACCLVLTHVIHRGSGGDALSQGLGGLGLLTGCLHHAGPEPGLLVQRVVVRAAQLVDVHAGWRTHTAIVADEHVEVLQVGWGTETAGCLPSPTLWRHLPPSPPPALTACRLYPVRCACLCDPAVTTTPTLRGEKSLSPDQGSLGAD